MKRYSLLFLLTVLSSHAGLPMVGTSFEQDADLAHISGDAFFVVTNHAQFGAQSLKWNGPLTVSNIRPLTLEESGTKYGAHFPASPTFVMSLRNETPVAKNLRVEFDGQAHFELSLNFKGWRTVWVPFSEMEGKVEGVSSVRFIAPDGVDALWLDDLVFSQFVDERHPYPGLEVPFIKEGGAHVNDHWMPKLQHWEMLEALVPEVITPAEQADLSTVEKRLDDEYLQRPGTVQGTDWFETQFDFSKPLKLGVQVAPIQYLNPRYMDLRDFGKLMLKLANEYRSTREAELCELFKDASTYYLDQGWAAGSSQGTMHHFGYSTRELHTAFFLMRVSLKQQGLLDAIGASVRWQHNFGEMFDAAHLESNLDYYNTQSVFRLMASFLSSDPALQAAYLKTYSKHLSDALALTNSQGFRPDGTAWHHYGHYPAYATGAFDRLPFSLKVLSGTTFRIREAGHANFKRAFMATTIYSNPTYYGLGLAGRHPPGGNIDTLKEACLALAQSGTPDGKQHVDAEVASVCARLWGDPGLVCELDPAPPTGHWTFPYAALSVHRRADWSVNIKGYSKYVWASEIYTLDNRYGRYQSSGVVQILPNMTQEEAGYSEDGWDWNHPPGATTIERSFIELEPEDPLVMFKSDEFFAGGCTLKGNGVWAMKLNEAEGFTVDPVKKKMSFPGNLKARKSVFCFGKQVLCLGSGIESDDPSVPVHTTLFQNGIKQVEGAVIEQGRLLLDPIGNGYKILDGSKAVITVGKQTSPNNKYSLRKGEGKKGTSPNASGLFAKAWLDHGAAPKNAGYAYSVYPQVGSLARIAAFPELKILQKNNTAHIVEDFETQTTAYTCFEAGQIETGLLKFVSVPCYVMIQKGKTLNVSVSNPDLNQVEDPSKGHYNGDSKEAPVSLTLAGQWQVKGAAEAWAEVDGGNTILTVKCVDGKSMRIELEN